MKTKHKENRTTLNANNKEQCEQTIMINDILYIEKKLEQTHSNMTVYIPKCVDDFLSKMEMFNKLSDNKVDRIISLENTSSLLSNIELSERQENTIDLSPSNQSLWIEYDSNKPSIDLQLDIRFWFPIHEDESSIKSDTLRNITKQYLERNKYVRRMFSHTLGIMMPSLSLLNITFKQIKISGHKKEIYFPTHINCMSKKEDQDKIESHEEKQNIRLVVQETSSYNKYIYSKFATNKTYLVNEFNIEKTCHNVYDQYIRFIE